MKKHVYLFFFRVIYVLSFFLWGTHLCAMTKALDVRIGVQEGITRFLLELSDKTDIHTNIQKNGTEVQIIFAQTIDWRILSQKAKRNFGLVKRYFYGTFDHTRHQFTLQSESSLKIQKMFWLKDPVTQNQRLILDLKKKTPKDETMFWKEIAEVIGAPKAREQPFNERIPGEMSQAEMLPAKYDVLPLPKPTAPVLKQTSQASPKIILIDPGHGGKDPGTIGLSGIYEKDIALQMGLLLRETLQKQPCYIVKMTRAEDVFVPLRERLAFARDVKADFVISLHADASLKPEKRGASIYLLSDEASDAEAEALAAKENKVDILHGVNMSTTNKEVSNILIDLAQRDTLNLALDFARLLHDELHSFVEFIPKPIRFADLAVLKAPDIPSILIELGCISNKADERLLKMPKYRLRIAQSVLRALNRFFGYNLAKGNVEG